MSRNSNIEWTDATWNPVVGCDKVSRGCDHCYAETIAERFRGQKAYPNGFGLTLKPHRLDEPIHWRKPRRIFVNSMSDLFHKDIPREYLNRVFAIMEAADWHTYQILTKRSSLMRNFIAARYPISAPAHIWLGVSIEDRAALVRLRHLRKTWATVRFVSFEPLLESIGTVDLTGVHWVIVGGESGPGRRPMHPDWAREIRDQCEDQGVAFFFKQWGGSTPKAGGKVLDGREWCQYPQVSPP